MNLLSNSEATPLQEIAADEARLALQPFATRRDRILASMTVITVNDEEDMRRFTDKIALARAVREAADEAVLPIGRPYLDSSHAVRNVALNFMDPLKEREHAAQAAIDAFRRRQREAAAKQKNEQAAIEAALREKAGLTPAAPAAPVTQADVRLAPVRSDYRGQVFDRKTVKVTIVDPRLLPDTILKSPAVIEALERAVRQLAKLDKNIPGALVEDDQATSVKAG